MAFTSDYSPIARERRRRSSHSFSKTREHSSNSFSKTRERKPLSRQTSTKTMASPKTIRRTIFLLVTLLGILGVSLLPGLALVPSWSRQALPSHHYLSIVDESHVLNSISARMAGQEASEDTAAIADALNSLGAALELKRKGNLAKANKVFNHALSLAPKNPQVLMHYGELLQEKDQLVEADHYYARAEAFSDSGSELQTRAAALREKTAFRVQEMDDAVLSRIDAKKIKFLDIRSDSSAMRRAKKEAYFQYIYHTVGIEGNTMSLAQTRAILETRLAVVGKSILEHNEILGMETALKFINNTLIDKYGDITVQDILEIHKRIIGNVDPVEAGLFRRSQVFVADHQPPPPSLLSMLMTKFVSWMNSSMGLHPVRLAALVHYKLVYIHPFLDGNGRTSRLLMNLVLMRAGFPPVIIRRSDRETYYRHLQTANEGDVRPFIRFIALCTEKTLDAYLWASKEYTMEVEAGEMDMDGHLGELPPNLVENTIEQVNTGVRHYRKNKKMWLNFAEEEEDNEVIQLGDGGDADTPKERIVLTMDDDDIM